MPRNIYSKTKRIIAYLTCACALSVACATSETRGASFNWEKCGAQKDGTYHNPVLPADFSDLDCIRVSDDYYAISSTMHFSPGMVVLHSRDLVNWRIIGHAVGDLAQIGPALNWDKMGRYGRGVWAGSIRFHNNKYYVFFGTPDEGYFMTTADNPAGPWAPLHPLMREAGWDDCSAIWDDNGQAWFVGTQFSKGYKTYLFKMSADGRAIDRESATLIHEGAGREANKLIKHDGFYYLVYSENTPPEGRYVLARRAEKMTGPWSEPRKLSHGDRDAREPNQGGIIQGPDGAWYFFTHHGSGAWEGRCASLTPVTWMDGWPVLGKPDENGVGHFVWSGKLPAPDSVAAVREPQASDSFDSPALAPQWEWNYQPRAGFWSLTERPGWLRLRAFPPLKPNALMQAGNTLTQRAWRTAANTVVIKLDLSGMADGQHAGLCHFARAHSALGIVQSGATRQIEFRVNDKITSGPEISATTIWLRSTWGADGLSRYAYSLDGKNYHETGEPYQLAWGNYRGDRVGIYNYNNNGERGYVDVDYFEYDFSK